MGREKYPHDHRQRFLASNCTQILERAVIWIHLERRRPEENQLTTMGPGKALTIEGQDLALLLGSPLLLIGYKSFALAGEIIGSSYQLTENSPLWSGCAGGWSSCAKAGSGHLRSHVQRMMEEEKGRWARVKARAGERLARAVAVR